MILIALASNEVGITPDTGKVSNEIPSKPRKKNEPNE
jgi:hypothetical protein